MSTPSPRSMSPVTLTAVFLLLVGCGGDSPTDSSPPAEAQILSYEALVGDWAGELSGSGVTFSVETSITRESATRGDVVGFQSWGGSDGSLLCRLEFRAEDSQPPIYWFDHRITEGDENCTPGTMRWEYDAATETVTSFVRLEGNSDYSEQGTLSRSNG